MQCLDGTARVGGTRDTRFRKGVWGFPRGGPLMEVGVLARCFHSGFGQLLLGGEGTYESSRGGWGG